MDYDDKQISDLIKQSLYPEAVALIRKEIKSHPDSHWLYACLSTSLYEQKKYKQALKAAEKALTLRKGRCPLTMWYYACALDMDNQKQLALQKFRLLLSWGISCAYGQCGEGERWTKAVLNDCRYRIALIYEKLGDKKNALKWVRLHLKHRSRGIKSIYPKKEVEKWTYSGPGRA